MLLDVLQERMIDIANHEGWEMSPLREAYQCCIDKRLEHTWLRKNKYFLSPYRKYYAGIFCNWDINIFEAFVVFLDKEKKEIKRVKLFETPAYDVDPKIKNRNGALK